MKRIALEIKIELSAPFHFGGGKGSINSCSYLQRDVNDQPYWSGSAFKGILRSNAMMLQEIKDGITCTFIHSKLDEEKRCGCSVCELFGEPGNARGSLYFHDLVMDRGHECKIDYRAGNAIDRYQRVSKDNHLFMIESVAGQLELTGIISGYLSEETYERKKTLLIESVKFMRFIGGNTSRGFGRIKQVILRDLGIEPLQERQPELEAKTKHIRVRLYPDTPVLIGRHSSESNFRDTKQVVSGSVLRACMAQEIIRRYAGDEEDGKMNFVRKPDPQEADTPFYNIRDQFTNIWVHAFMPMGGSPIPISSWGCKYQELEECKHQLYDILAVYIGNEENGENAHADIYKCPYCNGRMERKSGFFYMQDDTICQFKSRTTVVTKNAINRYQRNAQDEMLYSLKLLTPSVETIRRQEHKAVKRTEDLYFAGIISGDIPLQEVKALLEPEIHIGGFQTSGYGKMRVEIEPFSQENKTEAIQNMKARITAFHDVIREYVKNAETCRYYYIPVTLQTDALVRLPNLGNERKSDEAYVKTYEALFQGCVEAGLSLHTVMAQHGSWRGYDTSQKKTVLKEAVHLIEAGAVFVLKTEELTQARMEALYLLQEDGICSKKEPELYAQNGFGRVIIADSFHSDFAFSKLLMHD